MMPIRIAKLKIIVLKIKCPLNDYETDCNCISRIRFFQICGPVFSEKLSVSPAGSEAGETFQLQPRIRSMLRTVLRISMAMVIGPTPPGTGVM